MKKFFIITMLSALTLSFAGILGPWAHFKAVTADYTVNTGDTLVINAGTTVRFAPGTKLIINGVIKANGNQYDPIKFLPLSPSDPTWGGISISNSIPDEVSVFIYSSFYGINAASNGAVSVLNSNVDFNFCSFTGNHSLYKGGAIYISSGNVSINYCQFEKNSAESGGGLYIYNNSDSRPSFVQIQNCRFINNTAINGGGLYIDDYNGASFNMNLLISNSGFFFNKTTGGNGGGIYSNCYNHLEITLKKTKIQFNHAMDSGGGIYTVYNDMYLQPVLLQEYSNLLITQNTSEQFGAGIFFNSGMTTNPSALKFINNTIAYNKINTGYSGGAGISIHSEGNYPVVSNSIIWGNDPDQVLINDPTGPVADAVFKYCNVMNLYTGDDGISLLPRFVRPPLTTNEITDNPERYDYHLLISSPSIDAGDPATPCTEMNSIRVNQGAYGNTAEARLALSSALTIPAAGASQINVADYGVTVLNFQNAGTTFNIGKITLGTGSELHLKALNTLTDINIDTLSVSGIAKFDDERVVIQPDYNIDITAPQILNVTNVVDLDGADISDIMLNVFYNPKSGKSNPNINITNTTMYSSSYTSAYAICLTDASSVFIENCSIDNYAGGIQVKNDLNKGKTKASGRVANNSVTFDADVASKLSQQIGIDVEDSQIDIENNEIDNGEIGIQMSNSSGRVTNNTVSFEADVASKDKADKIAMNIISGSDAEITDNFIGIEDDLESTISGIIINGSKADISYNTINFANAGLQTRNGIVLNNADSTRIYNNTIYNPRKGIDNISALYRTDVINNIFWNDQTGSLYKASISDTTNLRIYNNLIEDTLPAGYTGSENLFDTDPLCIDPENNDLALSSSPSMSPCVNAGRIIDGVHIFSEGKSVYYYGSAPDIGAEELYQELTAPVNVTTSAAGGFFTFGWDAVPGFEYYRIYESDNPYTGFTAIGYTTNLSCTVSVGTKKFYYIVASTEPPKGLDFIAQNAAIITPEKNNTEVLNKTEKRKSQKIIKDNTR